MEAKEDSVEILLRPVMACFPTGVTIVAARDGEGLPRGLTVNSFTSVSLDPPLVLVCIDQESTSFEYLAESGGFVVSILSGGQADVAKRFARRPSEGRFDDVDWWPAPSGNPVVKGAVAWLDCSIETVIEAGDHSIFVGRPTSGEAGTDPALVFHRGSLGSIGG